MAVDLKRRVLVGTGGIGSGMFLELEGNETLGRNESRAARARGYKDYCKLHIIAHYPAILLPGRLTVVPVGRVGDDEVGRGLVEEMAAAGMDVTFVRTHPTARTTYSVCFLYPDGAGGNLTLADSASDRVEPSDVEAAMAKCGAFRGAGMALAAPEVPLPARVRLLELAGGYGFFRAATIRSAEAAEALRLGLFRHADLVALNADEARALAGAAEGASAEACRERVAAVLTGAAPRVRIVVTEGERGAHAFDGGRWTKVPPCPAKPLNTAGAGDAFLGTLLAAEAAGLPFVPDAAQLAALVASAKVGSRDTIATELTAERLRAHAQETRYGLTAAARELLAA